MTLEEIKKNIRKKQEVTILNSLGDVFELSEENEAINYKVKYKILKATFGSGKNLPIYIITQPNKKIPLGVGDFYLRAVGIVGDHRTGKHDTIEFLTDDLPEKNILLSICKTENIPTKKTGDNGETVTLNPNELAEEIAETHHNRKFIFCETDGVDRGLLEELTEKEWKTTLKDFLNEGIEKDKRIELIYKSDLVRVNPELIKPRHYQPYNSHELVFTNSKVTKTSTARITGIVIDRASPSNLLGYSTAQEIVPGSLDNETKMITIDEIQEEKNDDAYSRLSNYMELGETETRVGMAIVRVKGFAGFRWQGNPKERENGSKEKITDYIEQEIYQLFSDCLRAISKNNEAFGGRNALVVFAKDFKSVEISKKKLSLKENEENAAIVETVFEANTDKYSNLYFDENILEWLNEGFNDNYKKATERIEKNCKLESIKEFISGHRRLAHRHVRGKALKLALADKALEIFKGKIVLTELLELAGEYLKEVEKLNLASFYELVDVASKESTIKQFLKDSFEGLPSHLKVLLESVREYLKEHKEAKTFFLTELEIFYSEVESKQTTMSHTETSNRIIKRFDKTNRAIEQFGILLTGDEKEAHIFVKDEIKLNMIWGE